MQSFAMRLALVGVLVGLAHAASAQDYRARVQGTIYDESQGAMPGATVTLTNDATGVSAVRYTEMDGRYLFDFVDPGTYTITAELDGFKKAEQLNVQVRQRGDLTVNVVMPLVFGQRPCGSLIRPPGRRRPSERLAAGHPEDFPV